MKNKEVIPLHKLSDHGSRGMSLRFFTRNDLKNDNISYAHRDDHYIFLLQQSGRTLFSVDFVEQEISGACLFCILPGQVHYGTSVEQSSGWFLGIDASLVEPKFRAVFEEYLLSCRPLPVDKKLNKLLDNNFSQLRQQLQDEPTRLIFPEISQSMSSVCIGIIAAAYRQSVQQQETAADGRLAELCRQFRALLAQHYKTIKSPAQYASLMNLSLSYLNEAVKKTSGFPLSYWIQQVAVLEAKRLLYYTRQPVKEIAFSLGYDDHAYFSRIFSRAEGMSPGAFRNKYRE